MGSVLAILSAAAFAKARDAAGRALRLGSIYPVDAYASANPVIAGKLTADLYLVTVRDGRLWLVGALRRPKFARATGWRARANVVPVTDITGLVPRLSFDSGAGVHPAKLAMSLQTLAYGRIFRVLGRAPVLAVAAQRCDLFHFEVLGALGITASMQPVHCDPAIAGNWAEMLGPDRAPEGFNWPGYLNSGATLAFGTDTPTAPPSTKHEL